MKSELKFYEESVKLIQGVKLTRSLPVKLKGTIEFLACNDQMSLLPEKIGFGIEGSQYDR